MGTQLRAEPLHPLSRQAEDRLIEICAGAIPCSLTNRGIRARLMYEKLIETRQILSPWSTHKGGSCEHDCITVAGAERVRQILEERSK